MNDYHKIGQTYLCKNTKNCMADNNMYISRDLCSPAALAHLSKFMDNKILGIDASQWNVFHPPPLTLQRMLKKCEFHGTRVKLFNYLPRVDLDAVLQENRSIIEIVKEPLE
jgi:hypothetical protein